MRNFKRFLSLLLFAAIMVGFEAAFEFMLSPVTFDHYLDYDLKQIDKNGESVDMIFIGASRVYRSFKPSIFEEKLDYVDCAINCGTSNQTVDGTYYYLKDLLRNYSPKYVVVGIAYDQFLETKNVNIQKRLIVYDRIKSPLIKAEFAKEAFEPSEYPYLLKSFRYKDNVGDIKAQLEQKLSEEYRKGIDTNTEEQYSDKGWVHTVRGFKKGSITTHDVNQWAEDNINRSAFDYLDKIISMCKEKDIEVFLVSAPTTMSTIYCVEDYEEVNTCFAQYAKENDVYYDNFNLLKNRTELPPDSYMYDWNHVNTKGAKVVSSYYSDVINKRLNGEDVSDYFYDSVAQMKAQNDFVITCRLKVAKKSDDSVIVKVESRQNEDIVPEYKYMVKYGSGKWEMVQDYTESDECVVQKKAGEDSMKVMVYCRKKGSSVSYDAYHSVKAD